MEYKYFKVLSEGVDQLTFKSVKEAKTYIEVHAPKDGKTYSIMRNNKIYGIYHWDHDMNIMVGRRL